MTRAPRSTRTGRAGRAGRSALALALAVAAATAACGIPADEGPRAIPEERAPDDQQTDVEVEGGQTSKVELYFTRSDGERDNLVIVEREVPLGGSATPAPIAVLEALLAGLPEDDPLAASTATKIPSRTSLGEPPELQGGVLTVDLNQAISDIQGIGARLAFGQMVCTADALDGVDGVRFTREGEQRLDAPDGDGRTTTRPLTCVDYADLLGPRVTPGAGSPTPTRE